MSLQATILFSVELKKFHNVDLFQRGYYQVRSYVKLENTKAVGRIEKPILSHFIRNSNLFDRALSPGTVHDADTEHNVPAKAVSKTLHVMYKQDELPLNEVFDHKVQLQVNIFDFEVDIFKAGLTLCVELWFTDTELSSMVPSKLANVSQRFLKLHFIASRGLHYHVPVFFDYFHLCSVDMTIHGVLVNMAPQMSTNINQSVTPLKSSSDSSSFKRRLAAQWNNVLFGNKNQESLNESSKKQLTMSIHAHLCRIMLSAYESLLRNLSDYIECLPSSKRALIVRNTDCLHRLTRLVSVIQNCSTEEDISHQVARDIYKLSNDLKTLISKFVDIVTLQPGITELLKLRSHNQKMKRMSEAFFSQDSSTIYLLAIYDPKYAIARNSNYRKHSGPLPHSSLLPLSQPAASISQPQRSSQRSSQLHSDRESPNPGQSPPPLPHSSSMPLSMSHRDRYQAQQSKLRRRSHSHVSAAACRSSEMLLPACEEGCESLLNGGGGVGGAAAAASASMTRSSSGCLLRSSFSTVGGSDQRATLVRGSAYLRRWPALPVEIEALDATPNTVPIIFEEVFQNEQPDDDSDLEVDSNDNGGSTSSHQDLSDNRSSKSNSNFPSKLTQGIYRSRMIALDRPLSKCSKNDLGTQSSDISLVGYRKYEESASPYITSTSTSLTRTTTPRGDSDSSKSDRAPNQPIIALGTFKKSGMFRVNGESYPSIQSAHFHTRSRRLSESDSKPTKPHFTKSMPDLTMDSLFDDSSTQKHFEALNKPKKNHISIDTEPIHTSTNLPSTSSTQNSAVNGWSTVELSSSEESEEDISETSLDNSNDNAQFSIIDLLKDEHRKMTSRKKVSMKREKLLKKLSASTSALNTEVAQAPRLVSPIMEETMAFLNLKEQLRRDLLPYQGRFYSDSSSFAAKYPYFSESVPMSHSQETHLIVCVHGLDGNSADLRLVRTYIQLALPDENLEFLMSERIQGETFMDFDSLQKSLASEITHHINNMPKPPGRISFIGHSMGCILIRAVLTNESMQQYLPKLHTFLSLSGPHLGTVYNSSSLVNMGMWVMQKWKKSNSLLQLAMRDHEDPRRCYLYWLSEQGGLEHFRYVLLVSSQQDKYVPYHSTRIELCKAAIKDNSEMGMIYMEMVTNLLQRVIKSCRSTVIRYDVYHALDSSANSYIGRAAHIAVLDSEIFLEKFICVCAASYFR